MADQRNRGGRKWGHLPLPPPEDDGVTRIRMSTPPTSSSNPELPVLGKGSAKTTRFERLEDDFDEGTPPIPAVPGLGVHDSEADLEALADFDHRRRRVAASGREADDEAGDDGGERTFVDPQPTTNTPPLSSMELDARFDPHVPEDDERTDAGGAVGAVGAAQEWGEDSMLDSLDAEDLSVDELDMDDGSDEDEAQTSVGDLSRSHLLPLPPPSEEVVDQTLDDQQRPSDLARSNRITTRGSKNGRAAQQFPSGGGNTAVVKDPLAPLKAPLVGNRYRIVERIGQGGMGKVFKVTHAQLGKTFALKVISDSLAGDGKARELFYREARLASSLSHPNIASVVDFGEDQQVGAFMVMELLTGESLHRMLRREKRLGIKIACDIVLQVAEALHYIHTNKIVHCDIKTDNILLCELPGTKRRKLQVKLLDFGLARSTAAARNTSSLSGTPHYVAPERIRGEQPAPSADIYGLGILFFEMVTGMVPWDGNVAQILCGHLELTPTPPSQLIEGGLDPALEKLILRALEKDPRHRHKDMTAFIYELRTVMDMLGFGRRGKRGSGRKVVLDRPQRKRDELVRSVFDASRIPQALLSGGGLIIAANAAFAKFVMGVTIDVEGLMVQATPLATVWPTFENDLGRACAGYNVRRMLHVDVAPQETRRLLLWLDPGATADQALFGVHPLDA